MSSSVASPSASSECTVCGRVATPAIPQCSVSCNLAARIPLEEGGPLPVSWQLFAALASGFVLFNQFMLLSLFAVKRSQGAIDLAHRFELASIVVGSIWIASVLLAWGISHPKRGKDIATLLVGCLVVLVPGLLLESATLTALFFAIANLLISCRLYRGVYCLWRSSKKREN
jgi:hypothetical protein